MRPFIKKIKPSRSFRKAIEIAKERGYKYSVNFKTMHLTISSDDTIILDGVTDISNMTINSNMDVSLPALVTPPSNANITAGNSIYLQVLRSTEPHSTYVCDNGEFNVNAGNSIIAPYLKEIRNGIN